MSEWTKSRKLYPELVGQKFGDYVVISPIGWRKKATTYLDVQCAHGVSRQGLWNLKAGHVRGCRLCYCERNNRREAATETDKAIMRHFQSIKNRTTRASVNGWENYGAKGIKLCDEWRKDPMSFVDYMRDSYKPGLTVDRIDNSKGYEPGNVRWATAKEQALNRKTTHRVEWNNEVMAFRSFVQRFTDLSISQATTLRNKGWTLEQLATYVPREIGARVRYKKYRTT